jgi:hypothetical protein
MSLAAVYLLAHWDAAEFRAVINLGARAVALPPGTLLVSSEPPDGAGRLPGNAGAWLAIA